MKVGDVVFPGPTLGGLNGNDHRLQRAGTIDARSLWVACQINRGLLLPAVSVKIACNTNRAPGQKVKVYVEAHCRYCRTIHYYRLTHGDQGTPFHWNV